MSTSQQLNKILPSATASSRSVRPREITNTDLVINTAAAAATTRIYEMKIPLHNCDRKIFTVEEGPSSIETNHEKGIQRMTNYFKLFKWFVAINILILLFFCGYALWNLYQLERAMQAKEGATNLNRYFDRYDTNSVRKTTTTIEDVSVADFQDSVTISNFQEWRQSILRSLENLEDDVSYNLKFLLHTITSIVKNFVGNDKSVTSDSGLRVQDDTNSSAILNNKFVMTNLTNFEIHILKEFIKLKMLTNNREGRSRLPRTAKHNLEENGCDLHLMFSTKNEQVIHVSIEPKKTEGLINMTNVNNDLSNNEFNKDVHECIFNIFYTVQ